MTEKKICIILENGKVRIIKPIYTKNRGQFSLKNDD